MKIQDAYNAWSETYDSDRNLTRDLDQHVARQTLQGLRCKSILEIGCGTGKNTAVLAAIGDRVLSLDFSAGMIEKAKAAIDSTNVTFEIADITKRWPAHDESFDLVVCDLVLEHIENLSFIFSEAARVLIDGGKFFISELHPQRQHLGTKARFEHSEGVTHIDAFLHDISDFMAAADRHGLSQLSARDWWHEADNGKPPRLISFLFQKELSYL